MPSGPGDAPVAKKIAEDYDAMGEVVNYEIEGGGSAIDRMTMDEYFTRIGATGWLREMLDQPGRFPFQAVAPLSRDRLPFWQQRWTEQPQFLRALECSMTAETPSPAPARATSSPC